MRRMMSFAAFWAVLLFFVGCEKEIVVPANENQVVRKIIEVGIHDASTKTALGTENAGKFPVLWSAGDEIAVVENMGLETQKYSVYRLKAGEGTSKGIFEHVSGDAFPSVIQDVVYPASAMKPSDVNLDKIPVIDVASLIPSDQIYTKDSFDPRAAIMHFHSDVEAPIVLKPAASIVCIPVKGRAGDVVTSVRWQHFDGRTRTIDLNCPDGIELSDKVTNFYIAVPPMETNTANCIAYVNFKNGAVQVKTPRNKAQFLAGTLHRFPEWTMSKKTKWNIMYIGSERNAATWKGVPMGSGRYMIDDNELSWWEFRRELKPDKSGPRMAGPHKVIIDLGNVEHIKGFRIKGKEDKTSPKYGITYTNSDGKEVDIYGSQSYNPPYNVHVKFMTEAPDQQYIQNFGSKSDWKSTEAGVEFYHCTKTNGMAYYYGSDMKKWWEFDLKQPHDARYLVMHFEHGWDNAGKSTAASMLKIAEFDIY